jgi:hypothetical protein
LLFSKKVAIQQKLAQKKKEKTHWVRAVNKQYSNITTWDLMAF